jgi:hypothetical protein
MAGPWGDTAGGDAADDGALIVTTTPTVEGRPVQAYLGVVTGEVIIGANILRDMFAAVRDIVGGRSAAYESALRSARRQAFEELEAEARERHRLRSAGPGRIDDDGQRIRHRGAALTAPPAR